MIFKNLPALMTLIAAFITCIVTFLYKYELTKALILILAASVVFYFAGLIIRSLLNRFMVEKDSSNGTDEDAQEAGEETEENE